MENIKSKNILENIKSFHFLKLIFDTLQKKKSLEIIKYNKTTQNNLNININNYKIYSETYTPIEIEIIPAENKDGQFINILSINNKSNFHIYFNDDKKEIKRINFKRKNKVTKIKIIIDYQVKSFYELFYDCKCIKSIYFKKFYRNNIEDMSYMFYVCSSLEELDLSNFNTNNVTNMCYMLSECTSLQELNLDNFNTNNVTNMNHMFYNCYSLKELNISNFNTNNVIDMSNMFNKCSLLDELDVSNFITDNVINMSCMFYDCNSLKKLNVSKFNTKNETNMSYMFSGCSSLKDIDISNFNFDNVSDMSKIFWKTSEELKNIIKIKYKNIKDDSFD